MEKKMKSLRQYKKRLLAWRLADPANALWVSFLVPVLVMLLLFFVQGIYPFGDRTFLRSDMHSQYAPFFMEFYRKLHRGEGLWYTWNLGMGTNFWAIYVYYLAAPWNWLVFLCPEHLILEFMTYLMVLKMGTCSLSMTWYLRNHCKTFDFGTAMFGCMYGLSGYVLAYGWNIMWLDCLWLFPLIIRGLERLTEGKGGLFYCLTLGLSILCNYYISMMICMFLVLYFLVYQVLLGHRTKKQYGKAAISFAGYSVLAAGLSGILLLPEAEAIRAAGSGNNPFPEAVEFYFGVKDVLLRHLVFAPPTGLEEWGIHLPNLYCGSAVFVLLPLFFLSEKVPWKKKLICGLGILFFWFTFSVNIPDFIWHGFHYPRGLPGRQSFMYLFFVLLLCYEAYPELETASSKKLILVFSGSLALVMLLWIWNQRNEYNAAVFLCELFFLVVFGLAAGLLRGRKIQEKTARLVLFLLFASELCCHMNLWGGYTTDRTEYLAHKEEISAAVYRLKQEPEFFRAVSERKGTDNDGALLGLPHISIFSSTAYEDMSGFFRKLEGQATPVAYGRFHDTPLQNMLFSKRYWIGSGVYTGDWEEMAADSRDGIRVFQNPRALPLGFWADNSFSQAWEGTEGTAVEVQNQFMEALGISPPLEKTEYEIDGDGGWYFTPDRDGYYQVLMKNGIQELVLEKSGEKRTLYNVAEGALLDVGFCRTGERISLEAKEETQKIEGEPYYFSEVEMERLYETLSGHPWELSSWEDDFLEGTVSCPEAGALMTTIPFDAGWTVTVDGKEKESVKVMGAFLGVLLPEGTHRVTMEFRPGGLAEGTAISLVSAVFLAVILQKRVREKMKRKQKPCRIFWP